MRRGHGEDTRLIPKSHVIRIAWANQDLARVPLIEKSLVPVISQRMAGTAPRDEHVYSSPGCFSILKTIEKIKATVAICIQLIRDTLPDTEQ